MKKHAIKEEECCTHESCGKGCKGGCMGGLYGLGALGAAIYYISQATGFWSGVLGVLKALVWPAFLVYKILGM